MYKRTQQYTDGEDGLLWQQCSVEGEKKQYQADRNSDCRSVDVASGLARKQNLALACSNICAEAVEHNSGMCSRELMPDLSPFLYIHSATAHLRATLFKKSIIFLKPKHLDAGSSGIEACPCHDLLRGLFLFFLLIFNCNLLKRSKQTIHLYLYILCFFDIVPVPSSPLSMKGSITVSQ